MESVNSKNESQSEESINYGYEWNSCSLVGDKESVGQTIGHQFIPFHGEVTQQNYLGV